MADMSAIRSVLPGVTAGLMARANVIAVGIGYKVSGGETTDELAIICSVDRKAPGARLSDADLVPAQIEGIPTDVQACGPITALQDPTGRFRPAPGGVSLGHYQITAGTLGIWVKKNGQWMILSNNHVMANSNDAQIGDPILQPGPTDGGRVSGDQIARLSEFIPIVFEGGGGGGGGSDCAIAGSIAGSLNTLAALADRKTRLKAVVPGGSAPQQAENRVDAAIAEPLNVGDVRNEILNIGQVSQTDSASLGMAVKKMGRTTGFTTGTIQQVDVTVQVSYGAGKTATFVDQLIAGPMSQGGDSGSAVVSDSNKLVGLLFAGSTSTTVINRIENVFSALQLTL